jgi:EAL domain-containing protein (putative c-di-GMP-specific phosphodiesterase class I)
MQAACATLSRWSRDARLQHLSLSVNVSPKQFVEHDFIDHLAGMLQHHGVSGERLILEITEGTVLQNVTEVIGKMMTLRSLGVRMSIDDFGTGYSSLSYLQRLPLSELKIDRAFVNDMTEKEESYAIVSAILALAGKLHFSVVTEGVETVAQRDKLLELGATIFQGYLIAKPCNLAQFEALVADMATE